MSGPKIALAAMNSRTASAALATRFFRKRRHAPGGAAAGLVIEFDPPIEPRVGNIDEEIQHHEQRAIDDDHATAEEDIAIEDRVHKIATHSRNVEDRFHDDGTSEEIGGERTEKADHG